VGGTCQELFFLLLTFGSEWTDIVTHIVVLYANSGHSFWVHYYMAVLTANLLLWFVPMFVGAHRNTKLITLHVALVDTVTDIPMVIANIINVERTRKLSLALAVMVEAMLLVRTVILAPLIHGRHGRVQKIRNPLADYMDGEQPWVFNRSPSRQRVCETDGSGNASSLQPIDNGGMLSPEVTLAARAPSGSDSTPSH